jgi:putative toxin-antitoxin system antitoxin component (TIGR02293 family)
MTNDVYLVTNGGKMKKVKKITPKKYEVEEPKSMVNEPNVFYGSLKKTIAPKEFSYEDFKKISDKIPFTLAEWATILHLSERTLQRYAKNNSNFAPINAERIFLLEKVLDEARITFGKTEKFYEWISRNPFSLEGNISVNSLSTYEGIQNVLTQLGRIQHGIFA